MMERNPSFGMMIGGDSVMREEIFSLSLSFLFCITDRE